MSRQYSDNEIKKQIEARIVRVILDGEGIAFEKCKYSERPDFILDKEIGKTIGIEVVTYCSGNNAECEDAIYKILKEYGKKIDKESPLRYDVSVLFHGADLPVNLNFRKLKNKLFQEMDNCRLNKHEHVYNEYISSVDLFEVPGMKDSFVSLSAAFLFDNVDENIFLQILKEKDQKLIEYKKLPQNASIEEWWLVVNFPIIEHTDFEKFNLSQPASTGYDKIYLVEPYRYKCLINASPR